MLIEFRPATDPELAALLVAQEHEIGPDLADDGSEYLVVVEDGRAVACGAWQWRGAEQARLTHMYVRPAYRNREIDRQLIAAFIEEAVEWAE